MTWVLVVAAVLVAVGLFRLLRVVRSVGRAKRFWSQRRGAEGGLLYVALGDSAAQGVGASRPQLGYVGLLANHLRQETGQPVAVVNLSRSGARIRDVLSNQLPALAALNVQPDLVTIEIGGNDIPPYKSGRFATEAAALTAALPAGTVIADLPYFMHGHWERNAKQAAVVLTRSALKDDLTVVPLHEALRRSGWRAMFTHYAADWFHPNDRGYRLWERAFWTTISRDSRLPQRLGIHRAQHVDTSCG